MTKFDEWDEEKRNVQRIKETGVLWRLNQKQRDVVHHIEKRNKEGEKSKGLYKLAFDAIVQDKLG